MHSINFNLFPPSVYLKMHQMKRTAKVNGEGSVSCVRELLLIVPPGTRSHGGQIKPTASGGFGASRGLWAAAHCTPTPLRIQIP